jgi:flagellar protein FliO/FliZ
MTSANPSQRSYDNHVRSGHIRSGRGIVAGANQLLSVGAPRSGTASVPLGAGSGSATGVTAWPNSDRRPIVALLRVALLCAGIATSVFAADDDKVFTPGASRAEPPTKGAAASLSSMSLVFGLLLAGAGGWIVWRNRRGVPVGRDLRSLAIDETRSLGNRQFLVVASYEGKKFLIGVCPGRIDMLSSLDGSSSKEKARE